MARLHVYIIVYMLMAAVSSEIYRLIQLNSFREKQLVVNLLHGTCLAVAEPTAD